MNANVKEKSKNIYDDNQIYTSADFLKKISVDSKKKITDINLAPIKTDINDIINTMNTNTTNTNENERKKNT